MGLDIGLATINQQDLYQERDELFHEHRLSRQFCCLMLRRHNLAAGELAELEQLAPLTGVDITPLHAMDSYPTEEALEWKLESAGSEQARSEVMRQAEVDKVNLKGNLEVVLATVDALLDRLAALPGLAAGLITRWETHDVHVLGFTRAYFSDFQRDPGDGYIGNNLGQDLRNFKRFLEYAQAQGSTTVYFHYG